MIYENPCIDNNYIKLNDIRLQFEKNGIYLIKGTNGSGKTTLIDRIVFDEDISHFRFTDESEAVAFKKHKERLFTYAPQQTPYSQVCVEKYIKKLNIRVKTEEILSYLSLFDMPESLLKKRFYYLSGGEQKKISIISALLKKTPYIFLDEPTNCMDDGSVELLKSILIQEGKNRKIIIVTHDPRLASINGNTIQLDNGFVRQLTDSKEDLEYLNQSQIPEITIPGFMRFFFGEIRNFAFIMTCVIISIFLAAIIRYTNLSYAESIGTEYGKYRDSILAYYVGGGHDSLNEMYERGANLKVDENDYDKYISYEQLSYIAQIEHVNGLYIYDREYVGRIKSLLEDETANSTIILAFPTVITEQYGDYFGDEFGLRFTEGRLPKDYAKEVAISKELLKDKFGYNTNTVEEAIGNYITIGETAYKIVGFSYYDFVILSYDKEEDYGFYFYQKETFNDFYNRQMEYIKEIDGSDEVYDLIIGVDEKHEKLVLNTLMKKYPSNCYLSYEFEQIFYRQQKKEVFTKWLLINCLVSAVLSISIWFIVNKSIRYNMNIIFDYGNYYTNRKCFMKKYVVLQLGGYILIGMIAVIINTLCSSYSSMINWYILFDCMIMEIPIILGLIKGTAEVNSSNGIILR